MNNAGTFTTRVHLRRGYIYDAAHLLSRLYIRKGQVDRARSECEKALEARRRLLGKQSVASLDSTALMAYIYVLLSNRARAKSCLGMIPEARRDTVLKICRRVTGLEGGASRFFVTTDSVDL